MILHFPDSSLSSLTIHYENNTPFVEAAEVIREVEVSEEAWVSPLTIMK